MVSEIQLNLIMNNSINKQHLVSVIMNCYNGDSYLRESINSVLSQTYKNWELIFWDNRSEDKSAEIFKEYKDERFKYFYAENHTTLYKARNLAIEKSKGAFIAFIDTDDLWISNKLETQIRCFNDSDVGVVFSNCWILKNKKFKKIYINKKIPSGKIFSKLIENYNVGILTAVIRRSLYLKLEKKFDERFSIIGDYDLFLRLSQICSFKGLQQPLAFYRIHAKNLSNLNKEKEVEECEIWLNENNLKLRSYEIKILKKKFDNMKFVNYKIKGNYKDCIKMLFSPKKGLLSIKNFFVLFIPSIILKKLLWF